LAAQFYPKPDTLEWFQFWSAAQYFTPWLMELGRCVYPELDWKVMTGDEHSLAYGTDKLGNIKVLFDHHCFEWDACDLIEFASRKRTGPPRDWSEELSAAPIPPLFS